MTDVTWSKCFDLNLNFNFFLCSTAYIKESYSSLFVVCDFIDNSFLLLNDDKILISFDRLKKSFCEAEFAKQVFA